jgi:hypothetical protein
MEMSTFRGPSAENHHDVSPVPDDNKTTTSIPTSDDPVATRKCCTLCNLLVSLFFFSNKVQEDGAVNGIKRRKATQIRRRNPSSQKTARRTR